MTHELTPIDLAAAPELASLIEAVTHTHAPRTILRDGQPVARIVPLRPPHRHRARTQVDTSSVPPVPQRTVAELLALPRPPLHRTFTEEELSTAREDAHMDAWQAKNL